MWQGCFIDARPIVRVTFVWENASEVIPEKISSLSMPIDTPIHYKTEESANHGQTFWKSNTVLNTNNSLAGRRFGMRPPHCLNSTLGAQLDKMVCAHIVIFLDYLQNNENLYSFRTIP